MTYLASWLIERGISCQVNNYDDADIIAQFQDGPCAFEWQSSGHNGIKNLMQKRKNCENKHGRLFFVGSSEAVQEIKAALQDDKIAINRGKELEGLLRKRMGESEEIN